MRYQTGKEKSRNRMILGAVIAIAGICMVSLLVMDGNFSGRAMDRAGEWQAPGGEAPEFGGMAPPGANFTGGDAMHSHDMSGRTLPQEFVDACDGKSEGDGCATESPRGTMEGTCNLMDDVLACMVSMPGRFPDQGGS